jgi:hypothetical protein
MRFHSDVSTMKGKATHAPHPQLDRSHAHFPPDAAGRASRFNATDNSQLAGRIRMARTRRRDGRADAAA